MGETATGICTWDASPPYRPGLADVNGAQVRFRAEAPVDPRYMPMAGEENGRAQTEIGFAQVLCNAKVKITYVGGSPTVAAQRTIAGNGPGGAPPVFSVERYPGGSGSGDLFVSWPAGAFPPPTTRPRVGINGQTPGSACADWTTVASVAGIRVRTNTPGPTATDLPVTIEVN